MTLPRSTTRNCGRPLTPVTLAIRSALDELQEEHEQMTVRGIFYALAVRGVVDKTEAGYRQVQRQILLGRRERRLPWLFIADGTRWANEPETWDSTEDVLRETARTYRRNLWRSQTKPIEVWLEKDALASLVLPVTHKWGVRLMVSRGQSSDTYCYSAAREARTAWAAGVETVVFALYDSDRSGCCAAEQIEKKLRQHSGGARISFDLLGVTDEQIHDWNLPTRPAKESADEIAVELDAIPPEKLLALVESAIVSHVDQDAWKKEQAAEESERAVLARIAGEYA